MKTFTKFKILSFTFFIFYFNNIFPQLIRNDDFKFLNSYWHIWEAGNQSLPTVNNGMLHLQLLNATSSEYCNTELYDPNEPYGPGTQVKIRIKCSPQHVGSRGWGFWDGDIDLFSLLFDYDVAWIMEQGSYNPDLAYNWFLYGVDGNYMSNRQAYNLKNLIDETQWHTYKIVWRSDSTFLYVDEDKLFVSTTNLPDQNMRVDLWIDNRVININSPTEFWNDNSAGSEIYVDYVEVSGLNGPQISRNISGNILLWDSPNTYANGEINHLWKTYNFNLA